MSQKLVLPLFLAMVIALPHSLPVAHGHEGHDETTPDQLIREGVKSFKRNLRNIRGKSKSERRAQAQKHIDQHVTPHTDFRLMAERVFVDHWREIEARGLVNVAVSRVRTEYLRIQVDALAKFNRQKIRVFDAKIEGNDARVHLEVRAFKTITIDVFLSLREDGHWKIYDMAIVGASFVDSLREGYSEVINKRGLDYALANSAVHMSES